MSALKVFDSVRISDHPSSIPDPGDKGHGYIERRFAGRTGIIEKLDPSDSVHLVRVRFPDGSSGKAWVHEAHLTFVPSEGKP